MQTPKPTGNHPPRKSPTPSPTTSDFDLDTLPPALELEAAILLLVAVAAGALLAVVVLPIWLPSLSASMPGANAKMFWYLARSSGFVAYGLLWLAMALGLMITNKMARLWNKGPVIYDLHQYASLLGLAIALFHALILMGDSYVSYTPYTVLVPFASEGYRPLWVGIGQVSFYLLALVALSFYVRKPIGRTLWRWIHGLSFAVFVLALAHGIWSGTDTGTVWGQAIYWFSGGSLLFLFFYRVLVTREKGKPQRQGTNRPAKPTPPQGENLAKASLQS
jgi:predicted ferric reductase